MATKASRPPKASTGSAARRRMGARASQQQSQTPSEPEEAFTTRRSPESPTSSVQDPRRARRAQTSTLQDVGNKNMKYTGETVPRDLPTKSRIRKVRSPRESGRRGAAVERRPDRARSSSLLSGNGATGHAHHPRKAVVKEAPVRRRSGGSLEAESSSDSEREKSPAGTRKRNTHTPKADGSKRSSDRDLTVETRTRTVRPVQRRQSEPFSLLGPFRHPAEAGSVLGIPSKHTSNRGKAPVRASTQRRKSTSRPPPSTKTSHKPTPTRSNTAPSISSVQTKKSGIFSGFARSSQPPTPTIKRVGCLTCGEDDVPIYKTAKLACNHRMCHDCLRRIFSMSVTDPAHMPPKCCTADHIPLKHVDKLFDTAFKKDWNRKYLEFNTKNRIYCPKPGCGEWIKPNHISMESGRKVGKCKKCNTRVCGLCNKKMHTSRDCPKDPANQEFEKFVKEKGLQRCFRCKATVELQEGCNHITCRCTAEFCFVCGKKWKTCDCPWFPFEAVVNDRLLHMNPVRGRRQEDRRREAERGPIRYQEELDRRRTQERRDESMARRLQAMMVDEDGPNDFDRDMAGGIFGLGNAADHHLNERFRRRAREILTGDFHTAAREAEGLLNGLVTGRENPLPPAPFDIEQPSANFADQTVQFLRPDTAPRGNGETTGTVRGRPLRPHDPAGVVRGDDDRRRPPAIIPIPDIIPDANRRSTARAARRASILAGLFDTDIGSQTTEERSADRRIDDWRNEIPPGEPSEEPIRRT